jgi:hypothetical protein
MMFRQPKYTLYLGFVGIIVFTLVACSAPPAKTNTIRGQIIGPDGPVTDGTVWLSKLTDEDCAARHDRVLRDPETLLSETEFREMRECISPQASATTDGEGRYIIENVPAGWYHLSFQWQQNEPPSMELAPIPEEPGYMAEEVAREWRGAQLFEVTVREDTPGIYLMAVGNSTFNFSADTELKIDFIW